MKWKQVIITTRKQHNNTNHWIFDTSCQKPVFYNVINQKILSDVNKSKHTLKFFYYFADSDFMEDVKGFTLIELLVVVAIIGVLASIAIPQFADYKKRAFNARAQSDLRNLITGQEAYFSDNEIYAECGFIASIDCEEVLPGFIQSEGVLVVTDDNSSGNDFIFAIEACHPKGDRFYEFSSNIGVSTSSLTDCDSIGT